MASSPPKKKKRSLARPFVVTVAAVGLPGAIAIAGCGTDKPSSGAPGMGNGLGPGSGDNGTCTNEGDQRACHIDLGVTANKFQTCFYGTQTCTGGVWSSCGGEGTVTNTLSGIHVAPSSDSSIHTNAKAFCGDSKCNGTETCNTCPNDCCPPPSPGGSTGSTACTTDPCDPGCKGWDQNSAPVITSGSGAVGVSGFGQIVNGQLKKLVNDACKDGNACDNYGAYGFPSSYYNCQVDSYCQYDVLGGDGCCHQFGIGGTQVTDPLGNGDNTGIDITIGPGCADVETDRYRYFPICNRGDTAIPPSTTIRVKYLTPGFSSPVGSCANGACTAANFDCSVVTPAATCTAATPCPWPGNESTFGNYQVGGIPPGTCILLDTKAPGMGPGGGACTTFTGDKFIFANCDGAVAEGTMTWGATIGPATATNEPASSPGWDGCANNWSDHSADNNPPSCTTTGDSTIVYQPVYHAICPQGYKVQWNKLYYDTSCPKNGSGTTEVTFEAATAPDVAGVEGTLGTFVQIAEAQFDTGIPGNPYSILGFTKGSDPQVCDNNSPANANTYVWNTCSDTSTIGPSPSCCPKDFLREFTKSTAATPFPGDGPTQGVIDDTNAWLELRITLKSTPDGKAAPKLNSWNLSYTCVGSE